jgi:hypothetical protein
MAHCVADDMVLLNYSIEGNLLIADVCWLDRYAAEEICVEGVGTYLIPESALNCKHSQVLLDVVLKPVGAK